MPEDGGFVCVKTLDNWSFGSSLLSFVKGVEQLIADPNPKNPYGTDSCMAAAKWYNSNKLIFEADVKYGGKDA
jgi:ubiquitin-protein ligase